MSIDVQVGIRSAVQGPKSLAGVLRLGQLESRENFKFVSNYLNQNSIILKGKINQKVLKKMSTCFAKIIT